MDEIRTQVLYNPPTSQTQHTLQDIAQGPNQ